METFDISSSLSNSLCFSQLILGMSVFDLVGSVAWVFSSAAIPVYNKYGDASNVYGARGNEGTCKAQGFLIQLNFTALFYNISLSTYYLLGKFRKYVRKNHPRQSSF